MSFYMNMALNEGEQAEAYKRKKRDMKEISDYDDEYKLNKRMDKKTDDLGSKYNPNRYTKDTMELLAAGKAMYDRQKSDFDKGIGVRDAIKRSALASDAAARHYRRHGATPKEERKLKQFNRDMKNNKLPEDAGYFAYESSGIFSECNFIEFAY